MMKTFALAATVVAGLLCTASSADAQFRSRRGTVVYSYPTYTYPTYNGVTSVGTYTPLGGTSVIVPSSGSVILPAGYSESYYTPTYSSGSYYTPTYTYPTYTYPTYSNGVYYNGVYISPSGGSFRGRGWRW